MPHSRARTGKSRARGGPGSVPAGAGVCAVTLAPRISLSSSAAQAAVPHWSGGGEQVPCSPPAIPGDPAASELQQRRPPVSLSLPTPALGASPGPGRRQREALGPRPGRGASAGTSAGGAAAGRGRGRGRPAAGAGALPPAAQGALAQRGGWAVLPWGPAAWLCPPVPRPGAGTSVLG